jgi:hypothetical protein
MTLRFLGTGGAFSRRYGTTCSLVTFPNGERWLIDCGRQAPDQLWHVGLDWHKIDGQIVTHVHGDHIFGLEDFAFQRYYQALAASLRYLKVGDDPRAGKLESYFEIIEPSAWEEPAQNPWRHSETFMCNGYEIVARESEHVPGKPSCSLEIDLGREGEIAWWSGDCTVDAEFLVSIEPRTTIYFHDCTFTDYPGQVHGAFTLLEKLPKKVREKMVLMHHEDDIEVHREQCEALGFRIGLPGQIYDLVSGRRVQ